MLLININRGVKQQGDIKEICDLVHPEYGILTAIGEQHLDTFGNIDTIKKTKNELIECLSPHGTAFFNMDNEYCQELSRITDKKVVGFGLKTPEKDNIQLIFQAKNIQVGPWGSNFTIDQSGRSSETFQTKLLSEHNISNILGAVAVASQLGITLKEMKHAIKQLSPIPHRLELKHLPDHVVIIDDAFNSNPVGSKIALDVLEKIPGNRKIIVTPGMIDLGEKTNIYNKQFGEYMSQACDYIIVVGIHQTKYIQEALKEISFPQEKCFVAKNLRLASEHLWKIIKPHDIVLFENDLPDNYSE